MKNKTFGSNMRLHFGTVDETIREVPVPSPARGVVGHPVQTPRTEAARVLCVPTVGRSRFCATEWIHHRFWTMSLNCDIRAIEMCGTNSFPISFRVGRRPVSVSCVVKNVEENLTIDGWSTERYKDVRWYFAIPVSDEKRLFPYRKWFQKSKERKQDEHREIWNGNVK